MRSIQFVVGICLAGLAGCASLPGAERLSTAEATHSYTLSGLGAPVVVLEAGLGDGKESWSSVYSRIGRLARAFAYDRAGYGASRSTNPLRDGTTIVRELRATLRALNLAPPYILVGHSIGGTYMELYARSHPEEVAGVVLVDSRHADFTRRCRLADARFCKPPAILTALLPAAARAELGAADRTMEAVIQGGPFPEVPLVVLTGVKKTLEGARFREVWLDTQASLAALSRRSTHTVCEHCGHYIQRDDPDLVVAAVRDVIQTLATTD